MVHQAPPLLDHDHAGALPGGGQREVAVARPVAVLAGVLGGQVERDVLVRGLRSHHGPHPTRRPGPSSRDPVSAREVDSGSGLGVGLGQHEGGADLELHLVRDQEAAGLGGRVPGQAEVLAGDLARGLEAHAGHAEGILVLAAELGLELHGLGDAVQRQLADQGELLGLAADLGGAEGHGGELLHVEEVGGAQVGVAALVLGADGGDVDGHVDGGLGELLGDDELALHGVEGAAHLGDARVADDEVDVRVGGVEIPGSGGDGVHGVLLLKRICLVCPGWAAAGARAPWPPNLFQI
ncbi:Uncharacterised protein [Streptococcus pneumoniae]|nr:Uncharacterised protein [Streptococcus pneumoniae]